MRWLAGNLVLALVWAAVLGELTLGNLAAGFVLGFAILAAAGGLLGSAGYVAKLPRVLEFFVFFFGQLLLSSVRVAVDIVTPRHRARPGIVAVPLDAKTDTEITLLANFVSLTPGSLSLDVSDDRRTLFVHLMFLEDAETARREIKEGFERRILELLR